MNSDLISRSALINALNEAQVEFDEYYKGLGKAKVITDNAPTVPLPDFKEGYKQAIIDGKTNFSRPQGEWIKWNFKTFGAMGDWEYKCSNCEKVYSGEYNFCPNCGAKMKGN